MKARFIHDGTAIDYVPDEKTQAGSIIAAGSLIGIVKLDIPAKTLGALHLTGVYDVEKGNIAFAFGDKVHWSPTDKAVSKTSTDPVLGVAVRAAEASEDLVRIRLGS